MAEEATLSFPRVPGDANGENQALLEAMAKAGVWYGRRKSVTNPKMRPLIFSTRNGVEIFDLPQTWERIEAAAAFLKGIASEGGTILVVGTTPPAQEAARGMGEKFGFPTVTVRWLGGTLTNFKTLSARIDYYRKLRADREAGRLEKYTKKERSDFDKEIRRLETLFGGLEMLRELPRALLVLGASAHETALREAKRLKIPVVAIVNSDGDPTAVAHAIPANDRARASIQWVAAALAVALAEGREEAKSRAAAKATADAGGKA